MGGACDTYGKEVHTGVWWGRPEGKRPLARLRRRWLIKDGVGHAQDISATGQGQVAG
jgi:hypothetical protein